MLSCFLCDETKDSDKLETNTTKIVGIDLLRSNSSQNSSSKSSPNCLSNMTLPSALDEQIKLTTALNILLKDYKPTNTNIKVFMEDLK